MQTKLVEESTVMLPCPITPSYNQRPQQRLRCALIKNWTDVKDWLKDHRELLYTIILQSSEPLTLGLLGDRQRVKIV